MDSLVSIMIATYNQSEYIETAVRSALQQNYNNIEVIVADDSSDDKTAVLLAPFFLQKRFRYIKNPTRLGRVGNYRHLLHTLAKGDWVVMLDGDDYYIDDAYISNAMSLIKANENIVLVGASIRISSALQPDYVYGLGDKQLIFDGKEVFKFKQLPNHQTDVYPRRLAKSLDFYRDSSMGSDSESLYRLCLHGNVGYLPEAVAVWRIHEKNTTFKRDLEKQLQELVFIDSIYKDALPHLEKAIAVGWYRHMYKSMVMQILDIALAQRSFTLILSIVFSYKKYLGLKLITQYIKRMVRLLPKKLFRLQGHFVFLISL